MTPEDNENRYALLAAIVAAFVFASGVGFALDRDWSNDDIADRDLVAEGSSYEPDEPDIAQAPWRIRTHHSAGPGKPTNKQIKAVRRVKPNVTRVVRDVYDAMIVSRSQLERAAREWLTPQAAKALRAKPPIPFSLRRIKTTTRKANIGVELRTRARAAARVDIAFRADDGNKRLRFTHRGILWLQRGEKGWRVIAFHIDQRRNA